MNHGDAIGEEKNFVQVFRDQQHGRAMRAETSAGTIVAIYAGNWTQVQYVEGCL